MTNVAMMHGRCFRAAAPLLALVLVMSFVVAGHGPAAAQDLGSITLWHGWTGAETDTLNHQIIPAWQEANSGIEIDVLAVPFDQLKNKYQAEAATGGGPDLVIGPADWIGLRNYERIVRNQVPLPNFDFWHILAFNIVWTITNVFFHVVIGVAVALLLNRRRIIGRRIWPAVFVIPWAMPPLVVATVWRNIFDTQFGAINQLLGKLGLPGDIGWLTSTKPPIPGVDLLPLSYFAVLIASVWLGWPFMMVIATGALQSIPGDLYEAARTDGASRWNQFWDITALLLRPAMVPAIMYGTILTFNQFNIIYFITNGGPYGKTEILETQAFKLVNPNGLYGLAAAFSIMVFFILLVITLAQNPVTRGLEGWSDA